MECRLPAYTDAHFNEKFLFLRMSFRFNQLWENFPFPRAGEDAGNGGRA